MPKGRKRTKEEYEKEIEEAKKRMAKYPEYLQSAESSEEWQSFLQNIGISTSKADFWENVRNTIYVEDVGFTQKRLDEQRITYTANIYRDAKGHFTKVVTGKPIITFREHDTGRFISRKNIEK